MLKSFFILIMFIQFETVFGQNFSASLISDHLKSNANVVIRKKDQTFTITSKNKAVLSVYEVFTILNPRGQPYAKAVVDYDKLRKITSFSGAAYDGTGKLIRKLKTSDIKDQSLYDGSLFSDNRIRVADLSQASYPYTVEFVYQIDFKYLFDIPGIFIVPQEKISVEHTTYTLIYPKELAPRYYPSNVQSKPTVTINDDGKESISWSFKDIEAITFEPFSPSPEEFLPSIVSAPGEFKFEGYEGTMNTWNNFGSWIHTLNNGRGELSEVSKQNARELTAKATNEEEKVKILYEYLQSRTRYVSIQLGIGGLQPFPASLTDQVGYGDCKALSNYMVALLKAVDIQAYYALIKGGENQTPLKSAFPSSQFNHAIVAVPLKMDTIWLECTNQSNPFGYLGTFTGDRKALLITEQGGKVVNTIHYKPEKNIQARKAEVFLESTGDARAKVSTAYFGLQYENDNLNHIINLSSDEQRKWLQKSIDIPSFDINSFQIINRKSSLPSASINVDLTLKRYTSLSGKRMIIIPNLMNRSSFIPEKIEERKTNVVRKMAYEDLDTIQYHFPKTLYPELNTEHVSIKSRFGEYSASFQFTEGKLIYVRHIKMNNGEFPPDSYNELIDFLKNVNKADYTRVVLTNKG